jgi:hypothetical protein
MKFDFDKVISDRIVIDHLEVQSFEINIYLVKLQVGNNSGMLYQNSSLKRFQSTQQIRQAFKTMHVVNASLVHDSPFDEMIGNPPKALGSFVLPFSMTIPDE